MVRIISLLKRVWKETPGAFCLCVFALVGFLVVMSLFIAKVHPYISLGSFIAYLGLMIFGVNLAAIIDLERR